MTLRVVPQQEQAAALGLPPPGAFRNRLINGDFRIAQRGVNVTASTGAWNYGGPDRWASFASGGGQILQHQEGFFHGYAMLLRCTVADAALAAGDLYVCAQAIEGVNIRDLFWGFGSARPVTLSFEAHCLNIAAPITLPVAIRNADNTRSWVGSFTINAAGVFEKKVITIPGDTTGTWLNTTGVGLRLFFGLGVGSDHLGVLGWQAGNKLSSPGMTNLMAAVNNDLRLRNVQLEVGSSAYEFEQFPEDEILRRCQRYHWKRSSVGVYFHGYATTGAAMGLWWPHPVIMRAAPAMAFAGGSFNNCSGITIDAISVHGARVYTIVTAQGMAYVDNLTVEASCEL